MATTAMKATTAVSAEHGKPNPTPIRKGRLTDFWEKYPNGTLTILDRRAALK